MNNGPWGTVDIQISTIDISSDAKVSSAVPCEGRRLKGIEAPTSWTTSDVTFLGSTDGGVTFRTLKDEDNATLTCAGVVADSINYLLPATPLPMGLTHLKVRSTTDQAADRDVRVIFEVM